MLQWLTDILIIGGLAAFLALLLEIAHRFLADYGECRILINGEKELTVIGGSPLLFTLGQHNIFIPSACGGRGTCAYCKVKVLEGGGPILPTEKPYLTQEEQEAFVRLSCQVKVRGDLKIRIPEELFNIKEFKVLVEEMYDLTPRIKGLGLKILEPDDGISFKPGQYVQLEVPKHGKVKEPDFRAYSICSPCQMHGFLELMITRVEDGSVSGYVHDILKKGDQLTLRGPFGDFFYRDSDKDLLLIATGSGLAPIRSIIHHLATQGTGRKTLFFFGAKTRDDLMYLDELRGFEQTLPDFTFVPVLSRVGEGDDWDGERGRVTDLDRVQDRARPKPGGLHLRGPAHGGELPESAQGKGRARGVGLFRQVRLSRGASLFRLISSA